MASLPIRAVQLSVRYDRVEDRLLVLAMDAAGKSATMFMTRRLTTFLINELAKLLEKSSFQARQAPVEHRDDVIMFEHQGALQKIDQQGMAHRKDQSGQGPKSVDIGTGVKIPPSPHELVQSIEITTKPTVFEILIKGSKPLASMVLKRSELHQIVEMFRQKADAAGWQIQIDIPWLAPQESVFVIN